MAKDDFSDNLKYGFLLTEKKNENSKLLTENSELRSQNEALSLRLDAMQRDIDSLQLQNESLSTHITTLTAASASVRNFDIFDNRRKVPRKNANSTLVSPMDTSSSTTVPQAIASTSFADVVRPSASRNDDIRSNATKKTTKSKKNAPTILTKPTPIQLGPMKSDTYAKIIDGLAKNFAGRPYRWHQIKKHAMPRIFTEDMDTKESICDWLGVNGYEFNSYTERCDKSKSYLLRGIAHGDDIDNIELIRAALADAKIDCAFQKIIRFTTGYMKRNPDNIGAPIYQIVVSSGVTDNGISAIKTIGSFSVRFEKMKPSAVIQCHRCQRFAHTAANCSHKYRCVQCVTDHGPGQCSRIANKNIALGCINCKDAGLPHDGHTANDYPHCGFFKKRDANKANKVTTTQNGSTENRLNSTNNITEAVRANGPTTRTSNDKNRSSNRSTATKAVPSAVPKQRDAGKSISDLINALMLVLEKFSSDH